MGRDSTKPLLRDDDDWRLQRLQPPAPGSRPRVVIDTDAANEIDDQFALAWALLAPEQLRVQALYAAPFSFAHRHAATPQLSRELPPFHPPAVGMQRSFDEIVRVFEALRLPHAGRVFRGSEHYLASPDEAVMSEAVEHLIALARTMPEDGEPLYVVAIGAVTNVASALVAAPDIARRIVVVWTSGYPTHAPHINFSLNMEQDMAASRVVFGGGVPLVYLPGFHVGAQLRLSLPELERHVRPCGAIGEHLHHRYTHNPLSDLAGIDDVRRPGFSWVIWDLICIAWLLDPDWVPSELVATPGLSDERRWLAPAAGAPPMREAHAVARDAVFGDFFETLRRAPA